MSEPIDGNDIAVVGMAGRFPGARDLDVFWRNLRDSVESVRSFTDAELLAAGESATALNEPGYVKAGAVLDDIEKFDAAFFGWSPRDAAVTDPQHRLYLETAWAAFEDAGYDPQACPGPVAVFASCGMNSYMMYHLVTNREVMDTYGEWLVRHSGNDPNFLATRTSYELNLTGPSMNVQTACSSSLVAIHLACQSLLNGECDMALAGGATVVLPQGKGYLFKEGEILSPDGHCRPFDALSAGTLFGSGTGAVVLKRLSAAIEDGDPIHAVIKGSAVNNDGSQKVGYLAPSVEGQSAAVAEALAVAGVEPASISYVEAHGTGTSIGDPIEVAALTQAFRAGTELRGFCGIGSLKSNVGHLGEAAGVASFIKTVLSLRHRQIPPTLNYTAPNPQIDFETSPFRVNAELTDWACPAGSVRRAGVTALGAGGTNVHAILEEAPAMPAGDESRPWQLMTLSAKTASALDAASMRLAEHLAAQPSLSIADAAFTLQTGRQAFAHRRVVVCRDAADAAQALRTGDPKRVFSQTAAKAPASVVFMFPGGGAQYAGMGAELYAGEAVYREAIDECAEAIRASLGLDLRSVLFPPAGASDANTGADSERLERPSLALPTLFATEYALAKLLMSWGIHPAAMIGHSMGEYVAACLAGVFSCRIGMELVALRGRLFETVAPGGMLSIPLPEAQAREHMSPGLSFAAINGPSLCVASGPVDAIAATQQRLAQAGIESTRIHISVAAHSEMLSPILAEFERFCRSVPFKAPQIPYVSNLTGRWIGAVEATDPSYWVQHLRHTVRFADGLAVLLAEPNRILLEIGPGRTLSSLARQQPAKPLVALSSLRHPQEEGSDLAFLLNSLGRIWLAGAIPDWVALHGDSKRRRVSLPTYPFEGQRHWVEAGDPMAQAVRADRSLRKRADIAEWFYLPSWQRALAATAGDPKTGWLLFADRAGLAARLAARLPEAITVLPGERFAQTAPDAFTVRPGDRADCDRLFQTLQSMGRAAQNIVHLWAVGPQPGGADEAHAAYFESLVVLAQAASGDERPIELTIVSSGLQQVAAESTVEPHKALLLGPCRVIPHEFPLIRTRSIDVVLPAPQSWQEDRLCEQLLAELAGAPQDRAVALRGGERWIESFQPARLSPAPRRDWLREGGVYLVTGGLGGIGLELAAHLARAARVKLILLGRSGLPARDRWAALLADRGGDDAVARRIRQVQAIEALGAEVVIEAGDVTQPEQVRAVVARAQARFGALHGVVHAAGTIDDELMLMKSRESALGVIGPKVRGALALDAALAGVELDFFVLFSSVSSILGLQGQVDYTAANAFLDAFARDRSTRERSRTVAINWSAWQDVGMVAAITAHAAQRAAPVAAGVPERTDHPWLEQRTTSSHESVFGTRFGRERQWLLAEHVVQGGDALIPGTGFLELARAALEECAEAPMTMGASGEPRPRSVQISDVVFLAPFAVKAAETRELRLTLHQGSGEFVVASAPEGAAGHGTTHVSGKVAHVETVPPQRVDIEAVRRRCAERVEVLDGFMDQRFMAFGPRWGNLESIHYGRGEALVSLLLPAAAQADLDTFALHPALLDMATGSAQGLIAGFDKANDFFVPFSYGRLVLHRALPARLFSHVRIVAGGDRSTATFHVSLFDADGVGVAEITDFVMRRVDSRSALGAAPAAPAAATHAAATALTVFREGMLAHEGMEALDRILGAGVSPQIIASSIDLHDWIAVADAPPGAAESAAAQAGDAPASKGMRPPVSTSFVAPRDELEQQIAAIWQKMLGIEALGVHDDFFELGGHSLLLTQTVTRIRKMAQVDVSLRALFAKPTIAEIADEIRNAQVQPAPAKAAPKLTAVSRDSYRVKQP